MFTMLSHNQQYIIDPGSALSLSCVFYKDNFNLFDNPIQWKKIQYGDTSEINILGNIKEPFESTHRYEVTFDPQPPRYTMGLTVRSKQIPVLI
ncbi:hypothetical protein LSH36_718g01017 [Paralvinella palmiformis]|uniref:Uncharacterized protein n=1 Tax=Paralvinella palmiformis TaxID=53620 RepID=A0AAD9J2I8_9ANNE|nr:hypothetical protein LSH36_718g01017 [Paralvinella palmiformis]